MLCSAVSAERRSPRCSGPGQGPHCTLECKIRVVGRKPLSCRYGEWKLRLVTGGHSKTMTAEQAGRKRQLRTEYRKRDAAEAAF